jgi:hypothetical protein
LTRSFGQRRSPDRQKGTVDFSAAFKCSAGKHGRRQFHRGEAIRRRRASKIVEHHGRYYGDWDICLAAGALAAANGGEQPDHLTGNDFLAVVDRAIAQDNSKRSQP